ncbi:DUF7573 domain-containing protein [Haloarchaeobius litoreus]|uniref:DUF7573 domain-containing protein n=1 Tax=Haloarchaeobius litoreus TaxID=755306 RepID=A0ABD6DG94_9EURY|nr:hypothetical protein [Haloarchaeobius litoreus]
MTRDASLTEFGVGGDDEEQADGTTDSETGGGEATAGSGTVDDRDAPDPVRPTSRWSAEPRPCAGCGTRIQRAWTDDGRLLCADCKEW